jgi:hypothetical protein
VAPALPIQASITARPTPPSGDSPDARKEAKQAAVKRKIVTRVQVGFAWFIAHLSVISLALLPVYAALLSLFYFRRRRELPFVAHAVFTLHAQSALYLLYIPFLFVSLGPGKPVSGLLLMIAGPIYHYFALRGAYDGPGVPKAKTAAKAVLWTLSHVTVTMALGTAALVVYMLLP